MWIEKLSNKELLQMHRSAIIEDTKNIDVTKTSEGIYITAYENCPYDDGTPAYVPTQYLYTDYDYVDYDTSDPNHWETAGRYRQYMAKRFGSEYVQAMVKKMLNVDITKVIGKE